MKNHIVKVRERQGISSFDLTLPSEISKKYNIVKGDVFKIEVIHDGSDFKIVYSLVYKNK